MQRASDCDMVLAHDDDLVMIDGLGRDTVSRLLNFSYTIPSCWQSLETLEPDVMMDLLRRSNLEIDKVLCGELPTLIQSRPSFSRELSCPKIYLQLIVAQTPMRLL